MQAYWWNSLDGTKIYINHSCYIWLATYRKVGKWHFSIWFHILMLLKWNPLSVLSQMKSSISSIPNYSHNHLERAFFLWNIFPASQSCITENYSASHPSLKKKIPVLSACLNGAKRKLKIEASGQRELILFSKLKCSIRG